MNQHFLDISWTSIFKIAIALFVFYAFYLISDILIWFVFALIISILFNPAIDFLETKNISRTIGTVFVYFTVFGLIGWFLCLMVPQLVSEISHFTQMFSQYFERISPFLSGIGIEAFNSLGAFSSTIQDWLVKASSNIFSAVVSIFGGIFAAISIFSLAIFLSIEGREVESAIKLFSPKEKEEFILDIWRKTRSKVVGWFSIRAVSSLAVGVLTFLACSILEIKYAVSFGIMAGILDIIPIIGPIIAGAIITGFSLVYSLKIAIIVAVAFIIIQQIEGNILTPLLSKKLIGLPPALVLVALMIGGKLWGILGAVLAIPFAGMIFEFLKDFLKKTKESS